MLVSLGVLLFAGASSVVMIGFGSKTEMPSDASQVTIVASNEDTEVGGAGTPQYNSAVISQSEKLAQEAKEAGKSYIPPPVSSLVVANLSAQPEPETIKEQAPAPEKTTIAPLPPNDVANLKQAMKAVIDGVMVGMAMSPQTTINFKDASDNEESPEDNSGSSRQTRLTAGRGKGDKSTESTASSQTARLPGGIHAGSILYAVNDLKLSSDGKNPIVRASIISGPLNHYTALGIFDNGGETLSISFNKLISPDGTEYSVNAYGIDPSIPEANVASDVDNHYLSRWGGFMASSFLTGLADATRVSGTSSNGYGTPQGQQAGLGSYGMMTIPSFSLMEKGVIALGEVGREVGAELKKGLSRPATVTLDAGITMGILIISVN